jgi:carbonic anhydrase
MSTDNGSTSGGFDLHSAILVANRAYAETFAGERIPKMPDRQLFVLTCMDARVDPLPPLGMRLGDAHVVRNAGGRVTDDVIRSLVLSSALLGTRHAVVIHHTDCGLRAASDTQVRERLRAQGIDTGDMVIGTFADLDQSVRDDVETLTAEPLVGSSMAVWGYVYDVASGELRGVDGT